MYKVQVYEEHCNCSSTVYCCLQTVASFKFFINLLSFILKTLLILEGSSLLFR